MKLKSMVFGLMLALGALAPAHAQRGGGDAWELLGEEQVGFGNERDVINIGRSEEYFRNRSYRRLRFVVDHELCDSGKWSVGDCNQRKLHGERLHC